MPDNYVLGTCQTAEYSKWAEIHLRHPHDWRSDGPNKNLGFEAVLVHELLHVFIADCRLDLDEKVEEMLVARLVDCFMRATGNAPTL